MKENSELDIEIEQLLSLLSLWVFEPNAHLIFEYLLRRYLVHEYNTDALMKCILVSHDTKVIFLEAFSFFLF
jgi:U3 small nucleolar RNA-associated protein 10